MSSSDTPAKRKSEARVGPVDDSSSTRGAVATRPSWAAARSIASEALSVGLVSLAEDTMSRTRLPRVPMTRFFASRFTVTLRFAISIPPSSCRM